MQSSTLPPQQQKNNGRSSSSKFIFVIGGVMSGLGKGVTTSSTARLLQLAGYKVSCVKIDPYVNYDAGTMNPVAHGEVFVTDDGGECDMDIGNYERFIDTSMTKDHNITTGRIYMDVIAAEREGKYLGQCVQIIPHVTDAIKANLRRIAEKEKLDIMVVECGGTVGDIESLPFLEAFRQMALEVGRQNTLFIHVTLAPVLDVVGEQKTKPTQHSVQELRRIGIQPDIIAVRCKTPLTPDARRKISLFASVEQQNVISCHDAPSIYKVPEVIESQGMLKVVSQGLSLKRSKPKWGDWKKVASSFSNYDGSVRIAVVGKYVTLPDSYVSVYHALSHAGAGIGKKVEIDWIDSEKFENGGEKKIASLKEYQGVLAPGGFGKRGSEGIISAANFARENNIPYLGICFGFQLAIVAFARHVCGMAGANSTELDPHTKNPVVDFMPEQRNVHDMGGTMRLGGHNIAVAPKTLAHRLYGATTIRRRHRHRYEFNQNYLDAVTKAGLVLSAHSDSGRRMEILEIPDHKFYFAVQYHAEFSSRPGKPEQAFDAFVKAAARS
ncbi:CTP synthase [Candidatus Nitrososphaera evergladensis SR1]|uniref:CTP synthase n=1 Tax=Candidatus Nitrososphaera evergladensis SR1 TaxID=1459636 RepID=A0A075MXE8_9ARCH|nr:CTP synthase [Candidatus Nitrososphaera evergladensis]AIF83979.1 CTP synthase [Candidatus Nitrososphaera evergladensis SR1]